MATILALFLVILALSFTAADRVFLAVMDRLAVKCHEASSISALFCADVDNFVADLQFHEDISEDVPRDINDIFASLKLEENGDFIAITTISEVFNGKGKTSLEVVANVLNSMSDGGIQAVMVDEELQVITNPIPSIDTKMEVATHKCDRNRQMAAEDFVNLAADELFKVLIDYLPHQKLRYSQSVDVVKRQDDIELTIAILQLIVKIFSFVIRIILSFTELVLALTLGPWKVIIGGLCNVLRALGDEVQVENRGNPNRARRVNWNIFDFDLDIEVEVNDRNGPRRRRYHITN